MKIPNYQITDIYHPGNQALIRDILEELPFREAPIVLVLHDQDSNGERVKAGVNFIEKYLQDNHIHPHYPYPVYIVTKTTVPTNYCTSFESVESLPSYYTCKARQIGNKESALLDKIHVLKCKINNQDIATLLHDLNQNTANNTELYRLCAEMDFYLRIRNERQRQKTA